MLLLLLLIAPTALAAEESYSWVVPQDNHVVDFEGYVETITCQVSDKTAYYATTIDFGEGIKFGFKDKKKYNVQRQVKLTTAKTTIDRSSGWTRVSCFINYKKTLKAIDYTVVSTTHNTVDIKIDKTNVAGAKQYIIFVDGKEHQRLTSINDVHTIKNLQPQKTYNINVVYNDGESQSADNIQTATTKDPPPPPKLQQSHVKAQNVTDSSAELYVSALIPNYDHIYIYDSSDKLIHQQPITGMVAYRHPLKGLQQDKSYKYFVQVKHGNVLSDKLPISFKTPKTETEVGNLQGRPEGETVLLSWINPTYEDFTYVKIYRKREDEPAPKAKLFGFGMMTASAAPGYNPMFKFNGNKWQDLTVEAATTYDYKVTTISSADEETLGKTVKVKTPKPQITGSEITGGDDKKNVDGTPVLDPEGKPVKNDYTVKWTTPTKGQIKVMVGGKEYKTVDAATGQLTIPHKDMVYNGLDNPDVQLIPIADNGTTGSTALPPPKGGGTIGNIVGQGPSAEVNPTNLIKLSMQLLGKVALFVLLGLAFYIAGLLIRTLYRSYQNNKVV